jgi:tryptophanase
MENIRKTSLLAKRYGTRLILDSARFAENAYFIKLREEGYGEKTIREIVREIFSYADGMTMSSKKDAIVNMGGFIALKDEQIYKEASIFNIIFEGYITYGGMSGRDMNALAQGLYDGTTFEYIDARIKQVEYLGNRLKEYGIPIQEPIGGHAVFINALEFYPHISRDEFPAQLLALELYLEGGVRGVEIGTILADRDPETRENRFPVLEMVRLAIPRRVYSNNHMDYVAAALKNVYDRRNKVTRGVEIVSEAPIMRHFTVELKRL